MITLVGVIRKGFLGEVFLSWIEGHIGFRQEVARRGPACLIPVSAHRWPMALGVPTPVLISDLPPPPGGTSFLGWLNLCLAGWKHRQKEQGKKSRRKRLGREGRTLEKGWRGADLARAGAPGPLSGVGSGQAPRSWASTSFIYREENEGSARIF